MIMSDHGEQPDAAAAAAAAAPNASGGGLARSATPPRERSRGRSRVRRERQVVIHQAAATERAPFLPGAGTTFPTLTSTNYIEWSLVMKVHLESWGLWDAIEGNARCVRDDKTALGVLFRAVPPEMLGAVVVKETAKAAWDTIKVMRMGVHRVREATVQCLRTDFEQIAFHDGETLDAFVMRITSLVNQLRTLGDNVEEVRVVQKLLRVVPSRYAQIAVVIETLLDLSTISVEELIGRLRTARRRGALRRACGDPRHRTAPPHRTAVGGAQEGARVRTGLWGSQRQRWRRPRRRPRQEPGAKGRWLRWPRWWP